MGLQVHPSKQYCTPLTSQPSPGVENPATRSPFRGLEVVDDGGGFTWDRSRGKEEAGSCWPAEADSGCRVGVAVRGSTSRSRRCTEAEDLRRKRK